MLLDEGIEPFLIRLTPALVGVGLVDFFDSDAVVLCFPPGRRRPNVEAFMDSAMAGLVDHIQAGAVRHVLFTSSTSVYGAGRVSERDASEASPTTASGRALMQAEARLQHASSVELTTLRLAGLYGYERKPGRFMTGRTLTDGELHTNLVHRDDAVGVAIEVLTRGVWGEVFNVCADYHPKRAEFYTWAARQQGLPVPHFEGRSKAADKIVRNDKVRTRLGYQFKHPDPMKSPR